MQVPLVVALIACAISQALGAGVYTQRFLDQYSKIHNASNGY
ncbi:unnamed protein product, partial [Oppiella nova]